MRAVESRKSRGEKYKIAAMAAFLGCACLLTYYFHVVLNRGTLLTHLFYIPIGLAAFWWKRGGVFVALFLATMLLLSHNFLRANTVVVFHDYFRAVMLIVTGFLVALLSKELDKTKELNERVKELSCLYSLSKLAEKKDISLDAIFQKITGLMQNSWQYPDITCVRIAVTDNEFETENFKKTFWKQSADVRVCGQKVGTIEVYYLEEKPQIDEGPFLKEERDLIEAVSEQLAIIIERKQTEKALRESEEQYRGLFESGADALLLIDSDGIIQDVNPAACSTYGYSREKFIGMPAKVIVHPDYHHILSMAQTGIAAGDMKSFFTELIDVRRDGTSFPIKVNFSPIHYKDQKALIAAVRDITERKRGEDEMQQTRAELEHTSRLVTAGEMAFGLAHELNQPLCAILNYIDACLRMVRTKTVSSGKLIGVLEEIGSQADRAGKIIRRIRNLVRKREPKQSKVDINDIVREIIELEKAEADQNNVIMQTELAEDMPLILTDRIEIEQVILNLIRNGFDAMSDTGFDRHRLTIQTSMVGSDSIEVAVHDTGRGLPPGKAEEVFDSFFTTKTNGLGIGLSLSRSIIEAHGGNLWAEPASDTGATFRFTLPLKGAEYEQVRTDSICCG